MKIIKMTEETVSAVAALEQQCFSSPWSEESLRKVLTEPEFCYLLACEEDKVLGYGGVYFAADEANITNIAVAPEVRNRGIAKQLVRAIVSEAERRESSTVFLEVRAGNAVARHVYEQCGFVPLGVRKHFYTKPTEDGFIYAYRIER